MTTPARRETRVKLGNSLALHPLCTEAEARRDGEVYSLQSILCSLSFHYFWSFSCYFSVCYVLCVDTSTLHKGSHQRKEEMSPAHWDVFVSIAWGLVHSSNSLWPSDTLVILFLLSSSFYCSPRRGEEILYCFFHLQCVSLLVHLFFILIRVHTHSQSICHMRGQTGTKWPASCLNRN